MQSILIQFIVFIVRIADRANLVVDLFGRSFDPVFVNKHATFIIANGLFLLLWSNAFLFFVVIYTKNYSLSGVVFLFFQSKIANFFNSKINDSGRFRTTRFSSSRFGVRVTALPKFFTIYP